MLPARPTPRSSRRTVAAARSGPPRTVAETHVPCPRFQARGFKPEAQPTRLALRSGQTPPVPRPHSEVTAPPYTPQPRDRASCRRPNLAPEHHPEYAADPTVHCLTPTSPGTGTVLRSRNHARAAAIAHRIATGPNPLRQQHAGIATSHRTLRNPHQATHRNRPAPAQERIVASDGHPTRLLSSIHGQPPAPRFPAPFGQALSHRLSDRPHRPHFLLYSGNAPSRRPSDRNRHHDFRIPSDNRHHTGPRIATVTPVFAPCRAEARKPSAPDRHRTSPGLSPRRYPTGASPSRDTRPLLPGTPGRSFPGLPAAPSRDIRPLPGFAPPKPPRRQPPEDDLPKTTPKMPSRATKSGAAPQLTKKNGRSNMPANRRSAENRSPASLRDVPRPPRKTAELGKYAKCVRFVSDFGNFL